MKTIQGKRVLVTGGAMGLGKSLSRMAVELGASVIIWDINTEAMSATVEELVKQGGQVSWYKVDVGDPDSVRENAGNVLRKWEGIDVLVNNAGVVNSMLFHEQPLEKMAKMISVNTMGPMYVTRSFLPSMIDQEDAHIVNIVSGAGYITCPKLIVYCGSKWGALGWSEGLRQELMYMKHTHVHVTTVCPGHINTGMFDGVRSIFLMPSIETDHMAKAVWRGAMQNKLYVKKPFAIHLIPFMKSILSTKMFDAVIDKMGGMAFMAGFTGGRGD